MVLLIQEVLMPQGRIQLKIRESENEKSALGLKSEYLKEKVYKV